MRFELENKLNDFLVSMEKDIEARKQQKKFLQPLHEKDILTSSWKSLEKEHRAVDPPLPKFESQIDSIQNDSQAVDEDDDLADFIDENPWSGSKKLPTVEDAEKETATQELEDPLASLKLEQEKREQQDKPSNTATEDGGRKFPQVKIQQKKLTPKPKN